MGYLYDKSNKNTVITIKLQFRQTHQQHSFYIILHLRVIYYVDKIYNIKEHTFQIITLQII